MFLKSKGHASWFCWNWKIPCSMFDKFVKNDLLTRETLMKSIIIFACYIPLRIATTGFSSLSARQSA